MGLDFPGALGPQPSALNPQPFDPSALNPPPSEEARRKGKRSASMLDEEYSGPQPLLSKRLKVYFRDCLLQYGPDVADQEFQAAMMQGVFSSVSLEHLHSPDPDSDKGMEIDCMAVQVSSQDEKWREWWQSKWILCEAPPRGC
eukprot:CAMPEP_0184288838 /NCGR_PEP_ID=MMETSP1049-20130417/1326_1 /TAXON_ID=77928 /ORGANISM="Proteomonas sulcata, Strain CCMP704" /LENGTH=142 /DNA_ID=CAMNT_0026595405 /DNA_START=235 /DNA_END=663 /DNA_ORIENTATION=-